MAAQAQAELTVPACLERLQMCDRALDAADIALSDQAEFLKNALDKNRLLEQSIEIERKRVNELDSAWRKTEYIIPLSILGGFLLGQAVGK